MADVINLNLVHEIVHYGQHGDVISPIQDIDKYIREYIWICMARVFSDIVIIEWHLK